MKYIIPVLLLISCTEPTEYTPTESMDTIVEEMQYATDSLIHEMDEKMEYYKQKKIAEKRAMDSLHEVNQRLERVIRVQKQQMIQLIDTAGLN